eukprot:gene10999-12811_t
MVEEQDDDEDEEEVIYIVLHHAEKLLEYGPSFFNSLFAFRHFTRQPVCAMLIGDLPLDRLFTTGLQKISVVPRSIAFPIYTAGHLQLIIHSFQDRIPMANESNGRWYRQLADYVIDLFSNMTRDLADLTHITVSLLPVFIKESKDLAAGEEASIFHRIKPYIKHYLDNIYTKDRINLDLIFKNQQQQQQQQNTNDPFNNNNNNNNNNGTKDQKFQVEVDDVAVTEIGMSFYTKCLLVAGYLASTFSAGKDKLLYSKSKTARKTQSDKKSGPEWFEVERLTTIFIAIFPEIKESINDTQIHTLVASLVSMRYFEQQGPLEHTKLRCMASYADIKFLSDTIMFDIDSLVANAQFAG